ncbi:epithelial cell adhesion molecule-like [Salminus brasiliensis]|uniref:epithelial cell adhesion molecule-like n=1 Tax=Salminus brasiliensis TaxID=930266 RepID=UPI003B837BE9
MTSPGNLVLFLLLFVGRSHACSCGSLSWVTCDEPSCQCYINVGEGQRQILNCTAEIPKCFLMKAEMYRLRHPSSSQNKPTETALADSDELYDPDCESNGLFKAKQCNNIDVCWCVDSAGVHTSDKGDRNLNCDELVETDQGRNQLNHKKISKPLETSPLQSFLAHAIQDQKQVSKMKVKYDANARLITLDLKNDIGDHTQDLSGLGYYMKEDIDQMMFEGTGQKLEIDNIVVYYEEEEKEEEEEEAPTAGMQKLTFGILTITVVLVLAAVLGLLFLFLVRRQKRGQYEKAQTSEMEDI